MQFANGSFQYFLMKKFLRDPKVFSTLVGLLVGISACFLVAYRGTDDYESSYKSEQNLGGEYRSTRSSGFSLPSGVHRIFEVPVWDQTQGLGQRIPNLFAQQSQSPFVFLSRYASIETIVFLRMLFATTISLILINLVVTSWGGIALVCRIFLLDLSLLGVMFLNAVNNNFYDEVDQHWGVSLLILGMLHKNYFLKSYQSAKLKNHSVFFCLLFGSSFLFFGHPTWFQVVLFGTFFLFIPNLLKSLKIFKKTQISALLVTAILLPLIQIKEIIISAPSQIVASYSVQSSIWDVFGGQNWVYRFQPLLAPIASGLQPVLILFNEAGPRTEFFNSIFLVVILGFVLINRTKALAEKKLAMRILYSSIFSIFCLIFSGPISRSEFPIISTFAKIHAWRLSNVLHTVVTAGAVLVLGNEEFRQFLKNKQKRMFQLLIWLGTFMSLLYPAVMITNEIDNSKFAIARDRNVRESSQIPLIKYQRFADLSGAVNNSGHEWNSLFGVRFDLQLARAGYPSVEFFGGARHSSTLTNNFEQYRSGYVPNVKDCESDVLDFLAVSSIFINSDDMSGCQQKLITYFGDGSAQTIKKVADNLGTAQLIRPKKFKTWSISGDSETNPQESCPLLERNCLASLEVVDIQAKNGAPFKLCKSDCLFNYEWAGNGSTRQILVPANFDSTLEARDKKNGFKLKTSNFQGLLAVTVDSKTSSGAFEVTVHPDLTMWLRVATTYIHTAVFLGGLTMMVRLGWRYLNLLRKLEN